MFQSLQKKCAGLVCGKLHCCWRGVKFGTRLFCIFMADVSTTETYSSNHLGTCLLPGQLPLPEHPSSPSTMMVKKGYDVPCLGSWIAHLPKRSSKKSFSNHSNWRNLEEPPSFPKVRQMWHWDKSKCESWMIFSRSPAFHPATFPQPGLRFLVAKNGMCKTLGQNSSLKARGPRSSKKFVPWSDPNLMGCFPDVSFAKGWYSKLSHDRFLLKLIFPWCFGTCSRVVGHPCGTTSRTKMCSQTWASRSCHEPTKPSWLIGDPPKTDTPYSSPCSDEPVMCLVAPLMHACTCAYFLNRYCWCQKLLLTSWY